MNKIKELEDKVKSAQEAYYNGTELMSDDEYDAILYELSNLDAKNPLLVKIGSEPTSNEWKKEKHLFPLGSLNKVNSPQEMSDWLTKTFGNKMIDALVVEKMDGLSLGLQYDDGKLTKALLRGGGTEGENIYQNVIKMNGAVKSVPNFNGVIRGEIVLTKSNHQEFFQTYSNPRNAASGICRRSDGEGSEHLSIYCYQILGNDDLFAYEEEQLLFLKKNGFLLPNYKRCQSVNSITEYWQKYQDKTRASLDYEIDGLVISVSNITFQKSLGETNLRSKGKSAFKFAKQFISTTVKKVEFQMGKMGRATPVCWFEPVNLLGSNVEKASLYNMAYINELGIDVGAKVLICKAGEIIPRVEKVILSTGTIAQAPNNCPECATKLIVDGEYLQCPNVAECPAQIRGRIENWVSELNLLEWGTSLIARLVESNKVLTIADLYTLSIEDLSSIERMGDRSARKCLKLLWDANEISLDVFIGGMSIPLIGKSTIKLVMAAGHDTLDKILQASASDFEKVSGIGPHRAASLATGLKSNKNLINQILKNGVKIKEKQMGTLTGKNFVITGKLSMKRAEFDNLITENGGVLQSGISSTTNYLITNDQSSGSSKLQKAAKLGVPVINEQELLDMLDE